LASNALNLGAESSEKIKSQENVIPSEILKI